MKNKILLVLPVMLLFIQGFSQGGFLGHKNTAQVDIISSIVNRGISIEYMRFFSKRFGLSASYQNYHKTFDPYAAYDYHYERQYQLIEEVKMNMYSLGIIFQNKDLNVGLPAKTYSAFYFEAGKESANLYVNAKLPANLWITTKEAPIFSIKYRFTYSRFLTRNIFVNIGFDYGYIVAPLTNAREEYLHFYTAKTNSDIDYSPRDRVENKMPYSLMKKLTAWDPSVAVAFSDLYFMPHLHIGYAF